ncbi:hypothetical protein OAG24_01195, partial [bacterium]|nr:hypothetical protein [bacterium]
MEIATLEQHIVNKILFWCDYAPNLIFTCKLFCSYAKEIRTPGFFTGVQLSLLTNLQTLDCDHNRNFTDESLSLLTKLQTLDCGHSRNFTDEALSLLTKLQTLDCGLNDNFTYESL